MSVAGIVQTLCAMPVCWATGKNCVSVAGDSRRAASPADIVDWAPIRPTVFVWPRWYAQHRGGHCEALPAPKGPSERRRRGCARVPAGAGRAYGAGRIQHTGLREGRVRGAACLRRPSLRFHAPRVSGASTPAAILGTRTTESGEIFPLDGPPLSAIGRGDYARPGIGGGT